jgi:hypothetical protein
MEWNAPTFTRRISSWSRIRAGIALVALDEVIRLRKQSHALATQARDLLDTIPTLTKKD